MVYIITASRASFYCFTCTCACTSLTSLLPDDPFPSGRGMGREGRRGKGRRGEGRRGRERWKGRKQERKGGREGVWVG